MRISEYFHIGKTQAELDFVDVPVDGDIPLFLDPFALSLRTDPWSTECHQIITEFFQRIVDMIKDGKDAEALEVMSFLREPNETHLGLSQGRPRGAGIGTGQAEKLYKALKRSTAVKTGFISSLQECELMIEGIGKDKISDLTTNILRKELVGYTQSQCFLFGIPTCSLPLPPVYDKHTHVWRSEYHELPMVNGKALLLVPKLIARYAPSYDAADYYNEFVVNYLVQEALNSASGLVRTLRSGQRIVYKKDVKEVFPCTKEFLAKFSQKHPDVLIEYQRILTINERAGRFLMVDSGNETALAKSLAHGLQAIATGAEQASAYHSLMISILEFLFYPFLNSPTKETEIHQGRKRIDITFNNIALEGTFFLLDKVKKLPCPYVLIECKNYQTDIANPEIDQMSGRFSPLRGQFGMICCRKFEDKDRFTERCRDTFRDHRGLVIPLDDGEILQMLAYIENGRRELVSDNIQRLINLVWLS